MGCQIEFLQNSSDVDFSECPGTSLHFDAGDSHTVDEIQGSWFRPTRFRSLWAPLSAIRLVAQELDVESALKCPICLEVPRDALVHDDPWDLC